MNSVEFNDFVQEQRDDLSVCVPFTAFIVEGDGVVSWEEQDAYSSRGIVMRIAIKR